ncbi:MAG: hypothetical protein MI863_03575 [Desulfobacterales bacterium]|nr:hypothetical protein [Desulfobacterales bacterium]
MTRKFASIELARLYETQGYFEDALSMYRRLDDDVLKGGAEVRAAIKRIELSRPGQDEDQDAPEELARIEQSLAELSFEGLEPAVKTTAADVLKEADDQDNLFAFAPDENGRDDEAGSESVAQLPREKKMARLLEKWLMLMVVQRRVNLFRAIRARL